MWLDWGERIFLYYYQFFFSRPLTKPVERPLPSKHASPIINARYLYNNKNNNNAIVLRAPPNIHAIGPVDLPSAFGCQLFVQYVPLYLHTIRVVYTYIISTELRINPNNRKSIFSQPSNNK